PDVAVLDVAMPALNGIEVTSRIVASGRPTAIVILSMYYDESYIVRALKAGAKAYLLKDSVRADLIAAVHAVIEGRTYFSPKIGSLLQEDHFRAMTDKQKDDSFELLTTREREILQLAAEGKGNKEIASLLNVSMYTVDTHRSHILRKLNLHTAPELVLYAVRKGIIR
ncbi:MAG: response regulator transcription factor, partial [Bryobacteraceae bacterium]